MAARRLAARRDRLPGAVKVMFQPAEEGPGGALPMLEAGILEDPPVDAAFALHLWNEYPVGTVCVRAGAIMAAGEVAPIKPVVVTVASIHGGETFNVIPSEVTMEGTVRSLDPAVREELPGRIRRILEGIAEATRTAVEVRVG